MAYSRGPTDDPIYRPPAWSESPSAPASAWPSLPDLSADMPRRNGYAGAALPRRLGGYPVLMGVFFVCYLGELLYLQTRSDLLVNGTLRSISDLFVVFGSAVAAICCGLTASRLRRLRASAGMLANRAWLGWLCLGCAATTYTIGQLIWTWYEGHYTVANFPFPATYDYFYLAVYPFAWVGLALLIPRGGTAAGRTRLLLDAGIAVASALAITWYFILGPTIATLGDTPIKQIVALAYPLGDLSLCVAAALLLFGPSGIPALSGSLGRLAIGVTWLALTDSLYGYEQLQGTYHTGLIQDVGWPMAWLFIGWAALIFPVAISRLAGQRVASDQPLGRTRLSTTGAALRAITPIMLALLTCAVLLFVVALRGAAPLAQVVVVCAGLILLPVIRQLLTLIDNLILNERLRVALGQSQQAYQQSQQALIATSNRAERYDELREGIENLQAVHAQLARGDLSVRARVQGPLTPVAQSLNLLIDRLTRWVQFAQMNQVMDSEAEQLRQALDEMSEGRLLTLPASRSSLSTSGALVSAARLQRQLSMQFGRLRATATQLGRNWSGLMHVAQSARQTAQQDGLASSQQVQLLQDSLAQMERGLAGNQSLLQELWRDMSAYAPGPDGNEPNRVGGAVASDAYYGPRQYP